MASFNRQRCHVAILFLLLSSAIGSLSGGSLKELKRDRKKVESVKEANITSTTTPAANPLDETTTETANQNETSTFVYPTTDTTLEPLSDNPISETTEELQIFGNVTQEKQLNIPRSGNNTSLSYQRNTPITHRPGSPNLENAPRESPLARRLNVATSTPATVNAKDESVTSEGNGTFRAEDLLTPLPGTASFLAQLMSMSMQNLDTAFRGTVRHLSPVAQYAHSFRTTLLQISQKLNNAFLVSRTNADQIKMHSLFVPSKVKEAAGYLEKLGNSHRIIELIYLPLKNLKETADQTFNLSSQIAGQFGELVDLVDELTKIHKSSKSDKAQQLNIATTKIDSKNTEKNKIEKDLTFIENEIENLKKQTRLDEKAFYDTIDALNHLKEDKSQCYWYWFRMYCPPPDPEQIQKVNHSQIIAQEKLENTMKLLHAKEEEAREKREEGNQLLITTESLRREMYQLNEDLQLLRKTSDPLIWMGNDNNFKKLDKSWKKFVTICRGIQSGAKKNLEIIEDANRTSWSQQHPEKISFNLNKTKEDLLLVKTVIEFYLEGSSEDIVEIFAEVEQMMTKRENPEELERSLKEKCNKATEEIKTLTERNKGPTQTQTPKQFPKGKDSRSDKRV